MKRNVPIGTLIGIGLVIGAVVCEDRAPAQTNATCVAGGYRVVARRWDATLRTGWELRQDCAHPEWPARSVAVASVETSGRLDASEIALIVQPLLVRAGDRVRLWQQSTNVRIEMSGVAEESARRGEHVVVRVTRQTDDAGLTVQRIDGTVRGAGDVEMER
jgi:Chaperone for flagella basal body P-ring formation